MTWLSNSDNLAKMTYVSKGQDSEGSNGLEKPWYRNWKAWLAGLSLAIGLALAALIVVSWGQVEKLEGYGYVGALVVGVLESAIVIAPFPGLVVIFALGAVLNPIFVGLAVGTGEAAGALSLYAAGRSGIVVFGHGHRQKLYLRLQEWMKKRGTITLFLLSAILNPFFHPAGIAAGALKFPLWRYILTVWGGKVIKGIITATVGRLGLFWLLDY